MEYEFLLDVTGQVTSRFSMDHEAIGQWLNEEVKGDLAVIDKIASALAEIKGSERQWQLVGHEYTLLMDDEEVMVRANQLEFETDSMEEGMSYYDNESLAFCGTKDFIDMLADYRGFILQKYDW
ncbi:YacL family protein [Photorhabdus antumapuensis]|uniref:YacL family protein n=1 Tax=Photorhabdus antumapuensis TaxID=2862867 RepID=UPI001CED64C7|nr:YacL family protein [Photorhabdus antumapuensis]MCA6223111.1 YacL family protein [Photorhabdus antumapuensis]